jgi:hypothetical protein
MSLKLRRARVVEVRSGPDAREQDLIVALEDGTRRPAIADVGLHGLSEVGDELIVNVQALDLGLGSGGFDVVHANLTRGLAGAGRPGASVMKLNYTSLQHAVEPVEREQELRLPLGRPVAVLALHGQLAAVAWAFAQGAPRRTLGYVQTEGGALAGGHSRTVRHLRERGLLAAHLSAGAAFGGEGEAITTAGALHHGLRALGWDAAVCGPGPGIVGSSSLLGHGGMSALDAAHTARALGCPTVLVARMSTADGRPRHRGVSHHTLTVLDLLLEPVTVALPAGAGTSIDADLCPGAHAPLSRGGVDRRTASPRATAGEGERRARIGRHDWRRAVVDLPAYAASGLPAETMGRGLTEDQLFFAAALAAGSTLAELVAARPSGGKPSRTGGGADRAA